MSLFIYLLRVRGPASFGVRQILLQCTRIQEALLPIALEWESIDQGTNHSVLSDETSFLI